MGKKRDTWNRQWQPEGEESSAGVGCVPCLANVSGAGAAMGGDLGLSILPCECDCGAAPDVAEAVSALRGGQTVGFAEPDLRVFTVQLSSVSDG